MSQQSEFAEIISRRLTEQPVAVSDLVAEVRAIWGASHSTASVHLFVCEAIYCLDYIRVTKHGHASPETLDERLEAYFQLEADLIRMPNDLFDPTLYLLTRSFNDSPQSTQRG